jgi:hypothetical protein
MDSQNKTLDILQKIENGEINAEQALQMIADAAHHPSSDPKIPEKKWWAWWLVPFSFGMAGAAAGYGLSQLGGAWWICAGPLIVVGAVVMLVAVLTSQSPWMHVRVHTGHASWPRRIAIGLPLPLRFTAWVLRWVAPRVVGLDRTMVDELIIALEESVSNEAPITIEVNEGESGERVEVFLG